MRCNVVNKKTFGEYILSFFSAIGIISLATMIVLNLRFIYSGIIDKYNLDEITGVSKDRLLVNYNDLINYLENPFIDKLVLKDFKMSVNGEIHFYEVKNIFTFIIIIGFLFLIWLIFNIIKKNRVSIIRILNNAANIITVFFIFLVTIFIVNFSWGFTMFHKIFFRNDYWIFDPEIDPIINALPEELFFIYGAIILTIIFIVAISSKIMYIKVKKENTK